MTLMRSMPEYRLFLQGPAGRLERGDAFRAADDAAAITATLARAWSQRVELWEGGRRVQVFDAVSVRSGCGSDPA